MIRFSRHGKQVKATVVYKAGDIDTSLFFYWDCESEITAQALAEQLQEKHELSVKREIEVAYEAGI